MRKADLELLADGLKGVLGPETVRARQSLARHTAFRIGGPADLLVVAEHIKTLRQAIMLALEQDVPCLVLGGGSNVLVSDAGVRGLVVLNRARAITFLSERAVRAESGASFSTLAQRCVAQGLAGLEWATGIPGTVGGAVVGNAGAWGGDVASSLMDASVLEPDGSLVKWPVGRFQYSYRASTLKQRTLGPENRAPSARRGQRAVVLDATFALEEGDPNALKARVAEIGKRRRASQPPGATCGSVFKNPPGDFAGRLIEAVGLKGRRHGDAEISPVHANFIVNRGSATAADIKALIDLICETVQAQFGVRLELEIELVGDW